MINRDKVRDKLQIIKDNLAKLEKIQTKGLDGFLESPFLADAATHLLQVSIAAMLDISHHLVSRNHLGTPKSYRETVEMLTQADILPLEKLPVFTMMVKFRNRAVHIYDKIDDKEIFDIIENHLSDFNCFIKAIVLFLENP